MSLFSCATAISVFDICTLTVAGRSVGLCALISIKHLTFLYNYLKSKGMKATKAVLAMAIAISLVSFANAQNFNTKLDGPFTATKALMVSGVCDMCKHRIETAVKALPGIWSADWKINSNTLLVTYDRSKINPGKMEKAIASVGHDTKGYKAPDPVYAALPDCCHYQRKS
jgi:copper chaperone CopZ